MVKEQTKLHVYAGWADRLGCTLTDLTYSNLIVRHHSENFEGYNGVYCFYNGTTCVISAPPKYVLRIEKTVKALHPKEAFDVDLIVQAIGIRQPKVIGPAYQGYVDTDTSLQPPSSTVVDLETDRHRVLLEELRNSCAEIEWEHSAIDEQRLPILLCMNGERAVSAGSWRRDSSGCLSIGIISHPAFRGKGHAKAVVSALTRRGLASGAIMHYQTLESNTPSVGIAQSLRYERLARTMAIRIDESV